MTGSIILDLTSNMPWQHRTPSKRSYVQVAGMDTLIAVGERGAVPQEKLASFPGLSRRPRAQRTSHQRQGEKQQREL